MNWEIITFIAYFVILLGVALVFYFNGTNKNSEDFFLGGRSMGPWVTALSAQASDMSAWLLMGLPGSILAFGFGQMWIGIGLAIGTAANWILCAKRLRTFSKAANDSITLPQYLTNRFAVDSRALQLVCALIFLFAYTIYVASALVAGTSVFTTLFPDISPKIAMFAFLLIIVAYTFFGGFAAVCWTDFFQGLLMMAALMLVPIVVYFGHSELLDPTALETVYEYTDAATGAVTQCAFGGGIFNASWQDIVSGLGWGLGYFGMPHILVRYLSIKSEHEMRKSQIIGCSWIVLILAMSAVVGLIGREFLGEIDNENLVFVHMVRRLFPAFISGVLLSAILAAAMSTADSQLLASSSAFASDIYKPVIRKDATDHEMQWAGRIIVILISVVAYFIAADPNCGGIMALVECAWAGFGSAFGPVILLSLYWRRLTYSGAVAGVCVGFAVDALWYAFLSTPTGLYEIIPGFLCGLIAAVVVSLCSKAPSKEVTDLFDRAFEPTD